MQHFTAILLFQTVFFAAHAQPQQPFLPSLPIKHYPPGGNGGPYERERGNQPIQKSHYAPVIKQSGLPPPPPSPQTQQSSSSNVQQLQHQLAQAQNLPPPQSSRPLQAGPPRGYSENYIPGNNYGKIHVKSGGHVTNKPGRERPGQQQPPRKELTSSEELELYEEEQEPDRLTLLLQNSKFQCGGKKDGYYADDTLNCEVFHYCQDGGKHSWLCPNQFAFHQVHLICVPPSSDNICKQSSQFHFVNEYLYRPINEKEAQATNGTLIYADRYYPEGYSVGVDMMPYDSPDDLSGEQPPRRPIVNQNPNVRLVQKHGQTRGPQPQQQKNVFFSPEQVNIPLSERRPVVNPPPQQRPKYDYDEY